MTLSTGQILNNRYRIVKKLGQGGFGAVYRAWDVNFNLPCALKENTETTSEAQRQFMREAQILHTLRHPGLPLVKDHFIIPEQGQYLVMDYIEGDDLSQIMEQAGGPLPETQALAWIAQVCDALTYLHTQNPPVIHRDIKPANIKITPQGQAVLVDFGIAKIYDPGTRTTLGARAVTPGYAPFEQYGQAPTDARTDVYALGATLYSMLTGRDPVESITRMAGTPLAEPRSLNPAISANTEKALLHALAVYPNERFQTVAEFRSALVGTGPLPPVQKPASAPIMATVMPTEVMPQSPVVAAPPAHIQPPPPLRPVALPDSERKRGAPWILFAILGGVLLLGLVGGLAGLAYLLWPRAATPTSIAVAPTRIATEELRPTEPPALSPSATRRPTSQPTARPTSTQTPILEGPSRLTTITLWEQEGDDVDYFMDDLIADFQARYPNVRVERLHYENEALREHFLIAVAAGAGPDLIRAPGDFVGPLNEADSIAPANQYFDQKLLFQFYSGALDAARVGNVLWGVPDNYGNHLMLLYNKDLVPQAPVTFDEMKALARTLRKGDSYGLAFNLNEPYWGAGFFGSFGGWPLDINDNPQFDNQAFIDYLHFVKSLKDEDIVPQECDYPCADSGFREGRFAMIINGDWSLADYSNVFGDRLGVAPVPAINGHVFTEMTSSKFYMVSKAALDDPDHKASVEVFVEYMTSADVQRRWLHEQKRLPSNRAVAEDTVITTDPVLAGSMAALANGRGMPAAPEMRCAWDAWRTNLEGVMAGSLSPEFASAQAQSAADECVAALRK